MVKRNKELELEALQALKKMAQKPAVKPAPPLETDSTETTASDPEFALALRLSQEAARLGQAQSNSRSQAAEDELRAALAASVAEHDLARRRLEKEQADLEHAIALSMAVEMEKLRQLKAQVEQQLEEERQRELAKQREAREKVERERSQHSDAERSKVAVAAAVMRGPPLVDRPAEARAVLSEADTALARAAALQAEEKRVQTAKLEALRKAKQDAKLQKAANTTSNLTTNTSTNIPPLSDPVVAVRVVDPHKHSAPAKSPNQASGPLGVLPSLKPMRAPAQVLAEVQSQEAKLQANIERANLEFQQNREVRLNKRKRRKRPRRRPSSRPRSWRGARHSCNYNGNRF